MTERSAGLEMDYRFGGLLHVHSTRLILLLHSTVYSWCIISMMGNVKKNSSMQEDAPCKQPKYYNNKKKTKHKVLNKAAIAA